jgi:hypothetical protein
VVVGSQKDDFRPPDMLLRAVTIGDDRLQLSAVLSSIRVLSCIPQTRMIESTGESANESHCEIWSTRCHHRDHIRV